VTVVDASRPAWGEIWAFVDDEGSVNVHRCVSRRGTAPAKFWGDGNAEPDSPRDAGALIGRVTEVAVPDRTSWTLDRRDRIGRSSLLWLRRLPRRAWGKAQGWIARA
jgi:hypothetical protein